MTVAELRAEALTVGTGDGPALGPYDVVARAGETIGLSGPSASGKTTLLYALGGLEPRVSGRLLADGRDVVPWRELSTGIVFQNLCLVPTLSAEETVALPLQAAGTPRGRTRERAVEALDRLGLSDHVGQLVGTLSGGQRQRVAVARCLAARPALVLADEPTSALDEQWRAVVLGALHDLGRAGAIVVLASGDREVTAGCDRVVELQPALA